MSEQNAIKIVVDTNLWISFLLGKKLLSFKNALVARKVEIYFSEELYQEIIRVINYPRIAKVVSESKFLELIATLGEKIHFVKPDCIINDCRDSNDNFLLELAVSAGADYLVTGDIDLLVLDPYKNLRIVKAAEFEKILSQ